MSLPLRLLVALFFLFAGVGWASGTVPARAQSSEAALEIPHETFTLDNGLTVVVSEDHRAPLVNVRVWYHVGAQEGPYAHLFEHVLLGKTEYTDRPHFDIVSEIGAAEADATTGPDRTNYFQTVPTSALDAVLWLESNRMGYPLITQGVLDKEIKNVRNEMRMRKSRPSRQIRIATYNGAYPDDHPYNWTGEKLDSVTLDDMKAWHRKYYGAANATLIVTGDVELEDVREKMETYFAEIPPGPPVEKTERWIAEHDETRRRRLTASVSAPRLRMAWNVPPWGSPAADYLGLTRRLLAGEGTARLRQRLVEEENLATEVEADLEAQEIGSLFTVDVTASEGADLRRIEAVVQEEMERLAEEGPSEDALDRAKTQDRLAFAQDMQRLGRWSGGKSNALARGQVFRGDPGHFRTMQRRTKNATPADIQRVAGEWLTEGALVLDVLPQPPFAASDEKADRSEMPAVGPLPEVGFPELTRRTLENGLNVILAPQRGAGLVNASLVVPQAGYAADPTGAPGTAHLALSVLEKGGNASGGERLSEKLGALGAEMSTSGSMAAARVNLTALRSSLEPSLALFAEAVRQPSFSEKAVEEARTQQKATAQSEWDSPRVIPQRFFPALLYGEDHPYGRPFTGTGTAASLKSITAADLKRFYRRRYRPEGATLVVAGDVSAEEAMPLLRDAFGGWQAGGNAPASDETALPVPDPAEPAVYLVDEPGAERSRVYAAQLAPEVGMEERAAFEMTRYVLGGFNIQARLMQNLREDKGWTYRAFIESVGDMRGSEPLIAFAPVQTNKTAEAMQEIVKEWQALGAGNPVTPEELAQAKKAKKLALASDLQTLETTAHLAGDLAALGLPNDYYDTRATAIDRLTPEDVTEMARKVLDADELVWLVVGDLSKVEDNIRALDGFGEVRVLEESDLAAAE
jgi:zinc protease